MVCALDKGTIGEGEGGDKFRKLVLIGKDLANKSMFEEAMAQRKDFCEKKNKKKDFSGC